MSEASFVVVNGKQFSLQDENARKSIGNCGDLKTSTKHCLVDAINEVLEQGGGSGEAGFSPTIEVTDITGGHRLTITDVNNTKIVDVMDGTDGQDGDDGYTPVKGIDYFDGTDGQDGYTPIKGVDYFDGADGQAGKDGADGKDGSDGVSVTHSWNGTTLTVTSASGTSSANLKGDKGDTGATGSDATVTASNITNALGYTPANTSHSHSNYVDLTSAQNIKAAKTFDGEQKFSNASYCPTITDSASGVGCAFKASRGLFNEALVDKLIMTASTGKIPFYKYTGTSAGSMTGLTEVAAIQPDGSITLGTNGSQILGDSNGWLYLTSNLSQIVQRGQSGKMWFYPASTGVWSLGASSYKWTAVYATNGTIQTSDRNQKENIEELDDRYILLFDKLQPVSYKLIGENHDRIHIGYIAQDVKEAMDEVGLTDLEFAGYCRDKMVEPIYDENGNYVGDNEVVDDEGNPVYNYSLRYGEFIALNSKMIQINRETIKALQKEIDTLKSELDELKTSMSKS